MIDNNYLKPTADTIGVKYKVNTASNTYTKDEGGQVIWRYVKPHDYSEPIVIPETKNGMIGKFLISETKTVENKPSIGLPTCTYKTKNDCWLFCYLSNGDIPNTSKEGRLFLYIDSILVMIVGDESGRDYTDPCGFSLCLQKDRQIEIRAGVTQGSVDMEFTFKEFSIV